MPKMEPPTEIKECILEWTKKNHPTATPQQTEMLMGAFLPLARVLLSNVGWDGWWDPTGETLEGARWVWDE